MSMSELNNTGADRPGPCTQHQHQHTAAQLSPN